MKGNPFRLPALRTIDIRLFTKADASPSYGEIAQSLGTDGIARPEQVHGSGVWVTREPGINLVKADAVVTDEANLALAITWADCQNFLVYAPGKRVIGLIHAGWKGLRAGVIPAFFETLKREWRIDAIETFVGAGPSLCLACAEFTDPTHEVPELAPFIRGRCIDLRAAAERHCVQSGLPLSHFERTEGCPRCESQTYWTYRGGDREEVKRGRVNVLACVLRATVECPESRRYVSVRMLFL